MQLARETVGAVDALDEAVAGLVHAVGRAARHPAHAALPALELAGLLAQGERRLGELATQRGVCQSVVSRQVGELEARGLVVRRPDPADRRAGLVFLTPAGRASLETAARTRHRWLHDALARHPDEDLQAAVRVVRALADELDRRPPSPLAPSKGQS
jgi:DNA-binding MarR family transcriptional regulator